MRRRRRVEEGLIPGGITAGDFLSYVAAGRARNAEEGRARNVACEAMGASGLINCWLTTGPIHGFDVPDLTGIHATATGGKLYTCGIDPMVKNTLECALPGHSRLRTAVPTMQMRTVECRGKPGLRSLGCALSGGVPVRIKTVILRGVHKCALPRGQGKTMTCRADNKFF